MFRLPVRRLAISAVAIAVGAIIYACARDSGSPAEPALARVARTLQVECGETTYLAQLSPVLVVWEDSIETWQGGADLLDTPPAWTEGSTVEGHLTVLVPVLQQWESAINDRLVTAVLDTVADYHPLTTRRQDYLAGMSSLLVSWETTLETLRGTNFLASAPLFQRDETAPEIACASDTTITCSPAEGAPLEFEATAFDDCDPAPVVTCVPPSGSLFPVGATTVTCTALDSLGNTSTCSFTVTVEAAEPPVIVDATASPSVLWPPNHKWVDVEITLEVESECPTEVSCTIEAVTSNEPENGLGDGNTSPDWMITGDRTLKLRAERSGTGSGRVYSVLVRCEDDAGNVAERTVEVIVPHDQGHAAR